MNAGQKRPKRDDYTQQRLKSLKEGNELDRIVAYWMSDPPDDLPMSVSYDYDDEGEIERMTSWGKGAYLWNVYHDGGYHVPPTARIVPASASSTLCTETMRLFEEFSYTGAQAILRSDGGQASVSWRYEQHDCLVEAHGESPQLAICRAAAQLWHLGYPPKWKVEEATQLCDECKSPLPALLGSESVIECRCGKAYRKVIPMDMRAPHWGDVPEGKEQTCDEVKQ